MAPMNYNHEKLKSLDEDEYDGNPLTGWEKWEGEGGHVKTLEDAMACSFNPFSSESMQKRRLFHTKGQSIIKKHRDTKIYIKKVKASEF